LKDRPVKGGIVDIQIPAEEKMAYFTTMAGIGKKYGLESL
jgi:hypothetical protein